MSRNFAESIVGDAVVNETLLPKLSSDKAMVAKVEDKTA